MIKYSYTMTGSAANDQTWETSGMLEIAPGNFPEVATLAVGDAFMKLTNGKAIYGKPGVGCNGPYKITMLLVEAA